MRATKKGNDQWNSYVDWLHAKSDYFKSWEPKLTSRFGLHVAHTHQEVAFSDEATPDLSFQLIIRGGLDLHRLDMGFGKTGDQRTSPGDWVVVPPRSHMEIEGAGDFNLITISAPFAPIKEDIERQSGRGITDFGKLHAGINRDVYVEQLAHGIWSNDELTEIESDVAFTMLVFRMLALAGLFDQPPSIAKPLDHKLLKRVLDYIHANAAEPLSLSEMADIAECSRYHFCRAFCSSTGATPNAYLVRLRVENAKERIKRGEPLINAALDAGFSDQPHMSRCFKRVYGVSPGKYQTSTR